MKRIKRIIKKTAEKIFPQLLLSFLLPIYHYAESKAADFWYGHPSRYLNVVGVTGTKGKTTVVHLIAEILEEVGYKTAMISSLEFKIGEESWKNDLKMTMPGPFFIQRFLKTAKNKNCQFAIIEATSEGIKQFRHRDISWDSLVFTNIAPEHIESHAGFENYRRTKEKIFSLLSKTYRKKEVLKNIIVNLNDANAENFLKYEADEKYGYTKIQNSNSKLKIIEAKNIELNRDGINFEVNGEKFYSSLLGEFNLSNILAAVSFAISQNIQLGDVKTALEKFKGIAGRMEFIQKEPFSVIVDYAHTPDSLLNVYEFIKMFLKPKKLICALGSAGGGRDRWKRPEMGGIADNFCDKIILTNEDPYDEEPAVIINDIARGIKPKRISDASLEKILDRRTAIEKAIKLAEIGDAVIITGKGAEPWIMGPKGEKIPWDDREITKEILLSQKKF